MSRGEPWAGRIERTLRELGEDAETLQRAAAVLDDAVGEMRSGAPHRVLRASAAQVQSGAVALAMTLLAVVAQAERILALTGAEDETEGPVPRETARDALRTLRERDEALVEWREFADALHEVLRHARMLSSALGELHADVLALGALEGERNRVEAVRTIGDGSARVHSSSEHIVAALSQICEALASRRTAADPDRGPLRRRSNDSQAHQKDD